MKTVVRSLLERMGNRPRINDSLFYQGYLRVFHPAYAKAKQAEERFYRELLPPRAGNIIFDIGANIGSKTTIFRKISAKVIAVEPTPSVARVLQNRFRGRRNVIIVEKGVSSREGTLPLYVFTHTSTRNTFASIWSDALCPAESASGLAAAAADEVVPVSLTTLDALVREFGRPAYIKIDVEGFELEVLQGLTQPVPLLSFEANLPVFRKNTLECIKLLENIRKDARFNYVIADPPSAFASAHWCDWLDISSLVETSSLRYMEIYCRPTNYQREGALC